MLWGDVSVNTLFESSHMVMSMPLPDLPQPLPDLSLGSNQPLHESFVIRCMLSPCAAAPFPPRMSGFQPVCVGK